MGIAVVAEYNEGVAILSDEQGKFLVTRHSDEMIHLQEPEVKARKINVLPFSLHGMRYQEVRSMIS